MIRRLGSFALSAAAVLALWLIGATAARAGGDAEIAARLDALARAFMATDQVPGAIATVVSGDTVILDGYGVADLDAGIAASPDDVRFEIGSITKLFTWISVMMLVEEGGLDLEADVAGYLPDVAVPGSEPLTLAQLMSHRGGFEESYAIFDPAVASLPRARGLAGRRAPIRSFLAAPSPPIPIGARRWRDISSRWSRASHGRTSSRRAFFAHSAWRTRRRPSIGGDRTSRRWR